MMSEKERRLKLRELGWKMDVEMFVLSASESARADRERSMFHTGGAGRVGGAVHLSSQSCVVPTVPGPQVVIR